MASDREELDRISGEMGAAFVQYAKDPRRYRGLSVSLATEQELFAHTAAQSDLITNLEQIMNGIGEGRTQLWSGSPQPRRTPTSSQDQGEKK